MPLNPELKRVSTETYANILYLQLVLKTLEGDFDRLAENAGQSPESLKAHIATTITPNNDTVPTTTEVIKTILEHQTIKVQSINSTLHESSLRMPGTQDIAHTTPPHELESSTPLPLEPDPPIA